MKEKKTYCHACESELIKVDHYEYDGGITEAGSYEPYWECPNGCTENSFKCERCGEITEEGAKGFCDPCFGDMCISWNEVLGGR
jgi:uncharacterized protein with PIN domain